MSSTAASTAELTPRRIVEELDRYIVGQMNAKKAVAIAIRNRLRRLRLRPDIRDDVVPKNLILIGPTGVGKTEIARRIAALIDAPFVKVEASKFTEVGYVGRDVESIVRDLVDAAVNLVKQKQLREVEEKAGARVEERLLDALLPGGGERPSEPEGSAERPSTRDKFRTMLREGKLEDREVEVSLQEGGGSPSIEVFTNQGVEQMGLDFQNLFERLVPRRTRQRRLKVGDARELLLRDESERMIDREKVNHEAVKLTESAGIVFLDEVDKICSGEAAERPGGGHGPNVSREGVQRDLLPIVEGSTVNTRYGVVKTDHILFIAAGAFHIAKPSDLIPELQGRFPIRVELDSLGRGDFLRILKEPKNALTKQYAQLLETDGVGVTYSDEALEEVAAIAEDVNRRTQDIGARRLHTLFEKLLEDPLFDAPDYLKGALEIDAAYVRDKLAKLVEDEDLARYIL